MPTNYYTCRKSFPADSHTKMFLLVFHDFGIKMFFNTYFNTSVMFEYIFSIITIIRLPLIVVEIKGSLAAILLS